MKSFLAILMAAVALSLAPSISEAKRFGGGFSKGMQRSAPAKPAPQTPPAQTPAPADAAPAAAGTAAAGTAAAAGKRSWMGPIAGLAAGLGIVALFSALGLGAELANFMMIALLVLAAFMLYRFFTRRNTAQAGPRLAGAGAGAGMGSGRTEFVDERPNVSARSSAEGLQTAPHSAAARPGSAFTGLTIGSGVQGSTAAIGAGGGAASLPADFDREAFERLAKMIFIRMQAANDAADVNDLRNFTTPELFADLRLDLQERGPSAQHTDVQAVEAEVLEFAEEDGQQIVSVHYQGTLTEADGEPPVNFDEVWHLVKPVDGSRNWAIAGIQQLASE